VAASAAVAAAFALAQAKLALVADPKEHTATDKPARDYNRLATEDRMNVHPFVSVRYDIQVKPAEFPAFGPLLPDSEFRTSYSRYVRVKHQRIG